MLLGLPTRKRPTSFLDRHPLVSEHYISNAHICDTCINAMIHVVPVTQSVKQNFLNNIWIKSAFKTDIFFSFHLDFQPSLKKSLESALNPWVGKCLATFFLFGLCDSYFAFSQVFPNQNFASRQTHMSFNMGYTCLIWKTQICTFFLSFIKGCF